MKLLIIIIFASLFITSCKVMEKSITGVYSPIADNDSHLILKADRTFELAIVHPPTDHLSNRSKNYISGVWRLEKNRLKLFQPETPNFDDSITRFTNISCFNFWDTKGDPVSIRYILVPASKPKPHFGNSLYFFAQDFNPSDTLTFYFEGYPPFKFPGSVPATIGNNMHKITMQESYRNRIPEIQFTVRKKRLLLENKELPDGTPLKRDEKVYIQSQSLPYF
jgi:hypothetical protein